jgi:hypothetical protein
VIASWDGEEAWSTGLTTTAGSRAHLQALGAEARDLVGAIAVEMSGWSGGAPVIHPIAYADPMRPGGSVIAPGWLVRAALDGARAAGSPLGVGDPLLSWLYQPGVRSLRVPLHGDDLSFLQGGHAALFVSDSSFTRFYPWYHQPTDSADKLDAGALQRMGQAVLGAVEALGQAPRGPAREPHWFAAFGRVVPGGALVVAGALTLLPGLLRGLAAGGPRLAARAVHGLLFAFLLWRHPVPALWVFALPNLLAAVPPRRALTAIAWLPALALVALGVVARFRGFVEGVWLAPWDVAALLLALALAWLGLGRGAKARTRGRGRR